VCVCEIATASNPLWRTRSRVVGRSSGLQSLTSLSCLPSHLTYQQSTNSQSRSIGLPLLVISLSLSPRLLSVVLDPQATSNKQQASGSLQWLCSASINCVRSMASINLLWKAVCHLYSYETIHHRLPATNWLLTMMLATSHIRDSYWMLHIG
jgi:hypothetical protein